MYKVLYNTRGVNFLKSGSNAHWDGQDAQNNFLYKTYVHYTRGLTIFLYNEQCNDSGGEAHWDGQDPQNNFL